MAQQGNKTDNATGTFQDWEIFSNVIKEHKH